ncbi:MAG TPA: hypothetical protein VFK94_03630 [Patescibacteria group bacterium]|nr:hypothetical protein [Patescibacteria group bacterium]
MFPDVTSVFDAAGALSWGAAIAAVIEFLKRWNLSPVPETGRGVLIAVGLLSAVVVALGVWGVGAQPLSAQYVVDLAGTWGAVIGSAIGAYEVTSKAARVVTGKTNPLGEDVSKPSE